MAHFAEIDENNTVLQVIVVNNEDINNLTFPESEPVGQAFLENILPGRNWVQTSYSGAFRIRFASKGSVFYPEISTATFGLFAAPKPYDYFVFDDVKYTWVPPVPYPTDGKRYKWNHEEMSWTLLTKVKKNKAN